MIKAIKILVGFLCVSLMLNAGMYVTLTSVGEKRTASEDSLTRIRTERNVLRTANAKLRHINDSIASIHNEIMDFRHSSHIIQDSIIKTNLINRRNYGQNKLQQKLEQ